MKRNNETKLSIAARLISTIAPGLPPVGIVEHDLTPEQVAQLPVFLAAREAHNVAEAEYKRAKKALELPDFTPGGEKTVSLYATITSGKRKKVRVLMAEVQVSARAGYTVPPGFCQKIVAKEAQ